MSTIEYFLDNWKICVMAICAALFCLKELWSIKDAICNRYGIETKSSIEKKKNEETLNRLADKVSEIDTLKQDINGIGNKVDNLAATISIMQENDNLDKRASLKDRISQSYRYYHERQEWNTMEKEAFEDLVKSYENAGGKNSFVHSICEPESNTWRLIDSTIEKN